jgi:hypothetical protein
MKQQAEEIARPRAELEWLERDRERLGRENAWLCKKARCRTARRFRQAAPFSKGRARHIRVSPDESPDRPVGDSGVGAFRPVIDEPYDVPAPRTSHVWDTTETAHQEHVRLQQRTTELREEHELLKKKRFNHAERAEHNARLRKHLEDLQAQRCRN